MHGDVVVDVQNYIYFTTDGEYPIIVFDPDGKFVRAFGEDWKPDRDGNGTRGMQIFQEGREEFIYLTSLFRAECAKITLNQWGGKGKEDREFAKPHKAIIDKRGPEPLVLVTDRANHRLQWFTLEGKHVKTLDGTENDFLRLPSALNFRGEELVIADLRGRLTILDKDNKLITHLGDSGDPKKQGSNRITRDQWVDGQFIAPHGVTWDKQGNLYVSEWSLDGRLEKLKRLA